MLLSLGVGAVAHLWFAVSNDIMQMFAARTIAGLAAGNIGVIQSNIADRTSPQDRARTMGFLGAVIGAGFVIGPALGGLLSGIGSGPVHQTPFLIAAAFSALSFILAIRSKETNTLSRSVVTQGVFSEYVKTVLSGQIGWYVASFFCLNLAFAQVEASYVLLVRDVLGFGARQTGWLFTYIGVLIIIVQGGLISSAVFALWGDENHYCWCCAAGQWLASDCGTCLWRRAWSCHRGGPHPAVNDPCPCRFCFPDSTLTSSASKAASARNMGGSLGFIQGCGSIGQVLGFVSAGPFFAFWRGRGILWFWYRGHLLSVGFYPDDVKSSAQTAENG